MSTDMAVGSPGLADASARLDIVDPAQQPHASSSRVRLDGSNLTRQPAAHRRNLTEPDADEEEEEEEEERDRTALLSRAKDYKQLHGSVQTNTKLLDSLSTFLSTFQQDLSKVSKHIYELQDQSKEIDGRLEARRSVAHPINDLIADIILSPDLVQTIRDTEPGDAWLPAVATLHSKLIAVRAKGKVKAAHEIGMVVEGLKAKAVSSIRAFLLSIIKPIRSSVRTNIQVIQSSILLKYQPFFLFLRHHAPKVAAEVQRSYITSARTYYETSFRRYARAMGTIKARSPDKPNLIGIVSSTELARLAQPDGKGKAAAPRSDIFARLKHARLDADPVILAYFADEKDQLQPVEALFRSLLIVMLDNASAEFTFIVRYFAPGLTVDNLDSPGMQSASDSALPIARTRLPRPNSITSLAVLDRRPSHQDEEQMDNISDAGDVKRTHQPEKGSLIDQLTATPATLSMDDFKLLDEIWRQVMATGVEYCQTFFSSVTDPLAPPPAVPLLTMIRLNDRVISELDIRGCVPMGGLCTNLKLSLWPLFRKAMDAHIDSVKRLADAAAGTGFQAMLTKAVKDSAVQEVCARYATLFSCMIALDDPADQAMIFASMARLRAEVIRLVAAQANKIAQTSTKVALVTSFYDEILRVLKSAPVDPSHPLMLAEMLFFRSRVDDAQRQARRTL